MYVYEIMNTVTGKRYIGQTTNSHPTHRWSGHISALRSNRHANNILQNAWKKNGEEAFEFRVLEVCASEEALNDCEVKWIEYFNSTDRKFGYNILPGGSSGNHKRGRMKRSFALRPEGYEQVVDPTGCEHRIANLREFARTHDLTQYGLRQVVVTKRYFHYKGWRLATQDTIGIPFNDIDFSERGKRISKVKKTIRYPDVISPDGTTYVVESLSAFCKEHSLSKSNLCMLLHGKKDSYKGWKIAR